MIYFIIIFSYLKSPDTYFRWLESKLDLKTLDDLMKFDEALRSIAYWSDVNCGQRFAGPQLCWESESASVVHLSVQFLHIFFS